MKFGKTLEKNIQDFPKDWKPVIIQYKYLKKFIKNIFDELNSNVLLKKLIGIHKVDENISHYFEKYKIEYKFDVSPEYFQPYLKVELDSAVEINELYNCDCDENASNISSNQLLLKTKSSDS
ncbi:15864_t:CDS:2, partial [Entrophospora sp. SA101]